ARDPPAPDGELVARRPRERGRPRARRGTTRCRVAACRRHAARQRKPDTGLARARVRYCGGTVECPRVRLAAGAARHRYEPKRRVEAAKRAGEPTRATARRVARSTG